MTPREQVIDLARRLMARAERGEVDAFLVFETGPDNRFTVTRSMGFTLDDLTRAAKVTGQLAEH